MIQCKGMVETCEQVSPAHWCTTINVPQVTKLAKPGQFVHVCCQDNAQGMLRRPLSISFVDEEKGTLQLLYEVKGRGTTWLSKQKKNNSIDLIGPLGNGFSIDMTHKHILLIAGGIGVAPLFFLAQSAVKKGLKISFLLGAKNKELILKEQELRSLEINLQIATDDGSYGYKGFVNELLANCLGSGDIDYIYSCGPKNMLRGICQITTDYHIPCQVSLEENMTCGVGACKGCVLEIRQKNGDRVYRNVCSDGPVFYAEEVIF
ncbi:MAG: dihydroorotate dehydrogenase electron transfer subunit [Bacillota bacterium]|jgi:dihydroorotate dehydrogenase electron transfer subunit